MNYIIFAMGATFLVLILGLITLAVGGKFNRKYSSLLMSYRVIFQAIAILLIIFFYMSKKP